MLFPYLNSLPHLLCSHFFNMKFILDIHDMWPECLFHCLVEVLHLLMAIFLYYRFLDLYHLSYRSCFTGSPFYAQYQADKQL